MSKIHNPYFCNLIGKSFFIWNRHSKSRLGFPRWIVLTIFCTLVYAVLLNLKPTFNKQKSANTKHKLLFPHHTQKTQQTMYGLSLRWCTLTSAIPAGDRHCCCWDTGDKVEPCHSPVTGQIMYRIVTVNDKLMIMRW